jgi:hypothetical protein
VIQTVGRADVSLQLAHRSLGKHLSGMTTCVSRIYMVGESCGKAVPSLGGLGRTTSFGTFSFDTNRGLCVRASDA